MNIIFSDVDGTFQELSAAEIPAINMEAVKAVQKQGDRFVFVSGRNYQQMQMFISGTGLDCDLIFSNGAGYSIAGQEPQYTHTLSLKQLEYIVSVLEENECFYHVHTSDKVCLKPFYHFTKHMQDLHTYFEPLGEMGKDVMAYKEDFFANQCRHIEDIMEYFTAHPEVKPLKVELMDADDQKRLRLQKVFQEVGLSAFSSFTSALEIIDPESNKGAAIHRYLELFKGAKSYGIGDGENDLSMFEAVDCAIAVGNASEAIKSKCDLIIRDCLDGGVGHFLFENIIKQ